jgi:hypothetical protein
VQNHQSLQGRINDLEAANKRLLDVLWRIVASDPKHKQFATLVMAEAREAIEFSEDIGSQ